MAIFEGFVFASTDWNDRTNFIMQDFDPGVAPKRWQWISGADSDGALPVEEAHYDNAEMTVRLRIAPQANMDAALTKIGTLVLALQECEKQALGSAAVWTPAGSTKSLTAYIVGGEVTGIPLSLTGDDAGWFLRNPAPVVTMKLYRRPFLYGAEVTSAATVTNTDPVQLLTLASVTGDVPAEARLVITDAATQSRRHVEWGLQQRYYDAATSLLIDSDSLVTSGFAGTQTTRTGAYDNPVAGNNVIRGTLTTNPVAVCGTGNLGHVGTFRVKARVYPVIGTLTATDLKVRLSWKEGDGTLRSNDYTTPVGGTAAFSEVDLGIISIPEKQLGTQRWTGQIEAYSTTAGDTVDVDYIVLIPAGEGYGKGRVIQQFESVTNFSARDEFDQTAGALGGKTAAVGGIWAAVGTLGGSDLTVDATNHWVTRTADSDASNKGRGMTIPVTLTDTLVQIDTAIGSQTAAGFTYHQIISRYVDESNYQATVLSVNDTGITNLATAVYVAGVQTNLMSRLSAITLTANAFVTLRTVVDAQGRVFVWLGTRGATPQLMLAASHTSLATGGALASGKPGFRDAFQGAAPAKTRYYDNFIAAVPTVDAVVFSGRATEIRSDSAQRQDSTGTYYGPIQTYRGARFYIPPAGSAARTTRVLVKARRNDIDALTDDSIADSTTATLHYTPRFIGPPR